MTATFVEKADAGPGWPMSVPARLATTAKTLTSRVRTILGCQCLSISRQHTSSSAEQPHPCVGSESGQPVAREGLGAVPAHQDEDIPGAGLGDEVAQGVDLIRFRIIIF